MFKGIKGWMMYWVIYFNDWVTTDPVIWKLYKKEKKAGNRFNLTQRGRNGL